MHTNDELVASLALELRRGTLVLSVLSQLTEPRYGYSLVQRLEERGVSIDPGTLYPLLRRLERQQLLESRWETSGAKPRKYYVRTAQGNQVYTALHKQWAEMVTCMESLTREGGHDNANEKSDH